MKKIFCLLMVMGFVQGVFGQRYKAKVEIKLAHRRSAVIHPKPGKKYPPEVIAPNTKASIVLENGTSVQLLSIKDQRANGEIILGTASFSSSLTPIKLSIKFSAYERNYYVSKLGEEHLVPVSYCDNLVNSVTISTKGYHLLNSIALKIYPEISLSPSGSGHVIGSTTLFKISATSGFPVAEYQWQYKIDNNWIDMPQFYGQPKISFTGYELLGEAFDELCGKKNVHFRLKTRCEESATPITTATPKLSSPHITSITPLAPSCAGERDGSLRIQFDRPLKDGEALNLSLTSTTSAVYSRNNITALDDDNAFTWPRQLPPGDYTLSIIGKYKGMATYTDGVAHRGKSKVPEIPPVAYSTNSKNVNCFGGNDGTIAVQASGGVGDYTVGYKKAGTAEYQYQAFITGATSHTISGLDAGSYQVRLYDGNECVMKAKNGQEVISNIIIKQPLSSISVDHRQGVNPLAYRSTDGWASAIIKGGTSNNGHYNVTWTDEKGVLLSSVSNTLTDYFQTRLNNIGKGKYTLQVTDANYAATPISASAGCIVEETIELDEPPELKVRILEQQFVHCKGMVNGELIAIASGGIEIPKTRYKYDWFREEVKGWVAIGCHKEKATGLYSGRYKIKITDKNEISQESAPFDLTEPEALAVELVSSPALCSGSETGMITASIRGGTAPYDVRWNTGVTATTIDLVTLKNCQASKYYIWVKDQRGCKLEQMVIVGTPNPIEITNVKIKEPTCAKGADGAISFTTQGGVPPYNYAWTANYQDLSKVKASDSPQFPLRTDGAQMSAITNLYAGTYHLLLTDANGCSFTQQFVLFDPEAVLVDLGPERTLCVDQEWKSDARIKDPRATYQWTGPNGFSAKTPSVTLKQEGIYEVTATNRVGCQGKGNISIKRSPAQIESSWAAPTHAVVDEAVMIFNINHIDAEKIEWIFPQTTALKVSSQDDKHAEFSFSEKGIYTIALRSIIGKCEKITSKTITILDKKEESQDTGNNIKALPLIRSFKVGPNPSNGEFTVKINLEREATVSLHFVHVFTGTTVDLKKQQGSSEYTIPYSPQWPAGMYVLLLEVAQERRVCKVMTF